MLDLGRQLLRRVAIGGCRFVHLNSSRLAGWPLSGHLQHAKSVASRPDKRRAARPSHCARVRLVELLIAAGDLRSRALPHLGAFGADVVVSGRPRDVRALALGSYLARVASRSSC